MYLTNKICSFVVAADSKKDAYIKGFKKAAKYVASPKYKNISCKIEAIDDASFLFELYVNLDIGEELSHFCKMCKTYHSSFFVNEDYNCSRCNLKTFMERTKKKVVVSKKFYEEKMKNKEET